ncbi:substrate-binding domain-containing protein [Gryllotalpicola daejeonensis]
MTSRGAASAVGIVLRRSPRQLAAEPFYGELIGGLEEVLAPTGRQVLMQVVDGMPRELESYRRWAANGAVGAVVLVDLVPDDPRPELIVSLGLPGIILGEPEPGTGLATVRNAGYEPMVDAVSRLVALGHTRIARVTGPAAFMHTQERTRAYLDTAASLGISATLEVGDYSGESGADATRRLLAAPVPPTAIIYDNDVMAIAGLAAATELGVAVPGALSILAWDDSQFCRLTTPPVSAMSHDVHARGALAAHVLLEVLDGQAPRDVLAEAPVFVARGSTAAAPTGAAPAMSAAVESAAVESAGARSAAAESAGSASAAMTG